jgi:hypothetical protein
MIAEKLAQIERFLGRKGITLQIARRPPLDATAITKAERTLGHSIPEDLRDVYAGFADGFEVFWKDVRSRTDFDFARFCLPDIDHFVQDSARFREETRDQYDNPENYFERIEEARAVLRRMLNWGVLWDTGGDGNLVCIDLQSGAVLFHEREWSFYEPYINGYLIAASVNGLIEGWGNVCFLNFPGCPGDCPAHGGSAIPEYDRQEYNLSNEARHHERTQ